MASITPYENKLSNATVLVIGGTSGIGLSVASLCVANSARVVISSSNPKKLDAAVARLQAAYPSGNLSAHVVDLRAANVEESVSALFKHVGSLDHVVYTAGDPLAFSELKDITVEKIQKAGEVRFVAALIVAKYALQYLKPGPASSFTLTSGVVAEKPVANWSIPAGYAAGLYGMVRNLALDMKPIRVNLVSPGAVDTELWDFMSKENKDGVFQSMKQHSLTGEIATPDDVAESYLYIMRDHNATGVVIKTDSGSTIV